MKHLEPVNGYTKPKLNQMEPTKLGYSKLEASALTTLSPRTIDNLIKQGKLRAVKIGSRVIIPAQALAILVEKGVQ